MQLFFQIESNQALFLLEFFSISLSESESSKKSSSSSSLGLSFFNKCGSTAFPSFANLAFLFKLSCFILASFYKL
jgi:hypothetical protein